MSEQNTHAEEPPASSKGSIHSIAMARPARLLFKSGEAGWGQNAIGEYVRIVRPPAGAFYTKRDYGQCLELLCGEFGIDVIDSIFSPETMKFVIAAEDMDLLRQDGIGKTNAGTLLSFDTSVIANDVVINDPMTVLHENLRLAVHDTHAWHIYDKHKLFLTEEKHCDVFLPKAFMEQLALCTPHINNSDIHTKALAEEMLTLLLPHVPIAVWVHESDSGTLLTVVVKSEHYSKLDAAIMQAKQQPSTNVTSIESAAKRAAELTR